MSRSAISVRNAAEERSPSERFEAHHPEALVSSDGVAEALAHIEALEDMLAQRENELEQRPPYSEGSSSVESLQVRFQSYAPFCMI